ncbi:MAG: DUF504 domain-containing protein [Methanobacteriota archaeon]|nr:MAG: DUF504 domain-containing protein [Euryarchaeota archaeon]
MVYPREVLNHLKWTSDASLDDATVWYVHRGAPDDVTSVRGSSIRALGKGFFETDEASIPYHRVIRIEHRGEVVFDRERERRG